MSDNSIGTPSGLRPSVVHSIGLSPSVVHSLACRLARMARVSTRY
nr:MAG TPA: hypothetical protein [Caudoviricetes sp.]